MWEEGLLQSILGGGRGVGGTSRSRWTRGGGS